MVRLKGIKYHPNFINPLRFNSNMVRLKDYMERIFSHTRLCFNSNMVRLKGDGYNYISWAFAVSIPIWFD